MGQLCCNLVGRTVAVNGETYKIEKDIGEGAFSFVQLVTNKKERYALKRVLMQLPEHEDMVTREINAHKMVKNRYVMPLLDHQIVTKQENKEARLLFPYHELGTVQEMIEVATITKNAIAESVIYQIAKCLCEAVQCFHSHNPPYSHRDIKPHNLLILEGSKVVLMDMGSVREACVQINNRKEAMALQDLCAQECTAAYRAPELFEVPSECTITEKTDVWAIGCTMYAMACGESPCDGSATSAVNPRLKFESASYSEDFVDLVKSILDADPARRPEVAEIMRRIECIEINC